ncbi:MAG TPA: SDR family oxidoreductase [Myxococcales bacterium]|nr:SDR family oxidoreductase [Myxococcales bacterium]
MARLDGKVSLILGGAGFVGEGIVHSFLAEGAFVIVPSRSPERLQGLRKVLGPLANERLVTVPAVTGTLQGAEALRDQILSRMKRLDAVVASLGGFREGKRLVDTPLDEFGKVLTDNLVSHFIAARTFIPALKAGSTYTFIAGLAAEVPEARTGPTAIAMAGQQVLQRVLAAEMADSGVRINELLVKSVMSRARGEPGPETLTAEEVGLFAARLASAEGAHWHGVQIRLLDRGSYEMAMR